MPSKFIPFNGGLVHKGDLHPSELEDNQAQEVFNMDFTFGGMRPKYTAFTSEFIDFDLPAGSGACRGRPWNKFKWRAGSSDTLRFCQLDQTTSPATLTQGDLLTELTKTPTTVTTVFTLNGNLYYASSQQIGRVTGDTIASFRSILLSEDMGIRGESYGRMPEDPFTIATDFSAKVGAVNVVSRGIYAFNGNSFIKLDKRTVFSLIRDFGKKQVGSDQLNIVATGFAQQSGVSTRNVDDYYPDDRFIFNSSFADKLSGTNFNAHDIGDSTTQNTGMEFVYHAIESEKAGRLIWSNHCEKLQTKKISIWRSGTNFLGGKDVQKRLKYVDIMTDGKIYDSTGTEITVPTGDNNIGLQVVVDNQLIEEHVITLNTQGRNDLHRFSLNKSRGHFIDVRLVVPLNENTHFIGMVPVWEEPKDPRANYVAYVD